MLEAVKSTLSRDDTVAAVNMRSRTTGALMLDKKQSNLAKVLIGNDLRTLQELQSALVGISQPIEDGMPTDQLPPISRFIIPDDPESPPIPRYIQPNMDIGAIGLPTLPNEIQQPTIPEIIRPNPDKTISDFGINEQYVSEWVGRGIANPKIRGAERWGEKTGNAQMEIAVNDVKTLADVFIKNPDILIKWQLQQGASTPLEPNAVRMNLGNKLVNIPGLLASAGLSHEGFHFRSSGFPFGNETYSQVMDRKNRDDFNPLLNNRLVNLYTSAFDLKLPVGVVYPTELYFNTLGFGGQIRTVDTNQIDFVKTATDLLKLLPVDTTNSTNTSRVEADDTDEKKSELTKLAESFNGPKYDHPIGHIKYFLPYQKRINKDQPFTQEIPDLPQAAPPIDNAESYMKTNYGVAGAGRGDQINKIDFIKGAAPGVYRDGKRPVDSLNEVYTHLTDGQVTRGDLINFIISGQNEIGKAATDILVFRAFITSLSDSISPSWDDVQILGRADAVSIQKSFSRELSITFNVVAFSKDEMKPIWRKLNYLVSKTAPNYSGTSFYGNFIRITIGDMFKETPCFITSLSLTYDMEAGWELNQAGDSAQLPKKIEVSMNLRMIHDFRPQDNGRFYSLSTRGRREQNQPDENWLSDSSIDS